MKQPIDDANPQHCASLEHTFAVTIETLLSPTDALDKVHVRDLCRLLQFARSERKTLYRYMTSANRIPQAEAKRLNSLFYEEYERITSALRSLEQLIESKLGFVPTVLNRTFFEEYDAFCRKHRVPIVYHRPLPNKRWRIQR
ncbi:MAG: hypothetical protein ACRC5C_15525 [Bacilli bacterium]